MHKGEASLDSREPRPPRRAIASPWRILVPCHGCRHSLTFRNHGETVVLVDNSLDVPDEVLRHDGDLPRIHPDVPVPIHSDRDYATAGLKRALARDLKAPARWIRLIMREVWSAAAGQEKWPQPRTERAPRRRALRRWAATGPSG